jgi:hypothetical protein
MPFARGARIELTNDQEEEVPAFWYHVDYEEFASLGDDVGRFHAQWRRENPTLIDPGVEEGGRKGLNLTGDGNYVVLDAEGRGNYVGFVLGVDNVAGDWWGEGDDMIFIDGEAWPPSFHGTGTEEIFGGGACPNLEYAGPYTGFHQISDKLWAGKNGMYRLFINDPIRFQKSIRVTLEHGHANDLPNDYSSVAFWYQSEPHARFPALRPVAQRLPRVKPAFAELQARDRALTQRIWRDGRSLSHAVRHQLLVDLWRPLNDAFAHEDYERAREYMEKLDAMLDQHVGSSGDATA